MARMPRKFVVEESEVGVYHCINRCVRRAFLCGTDPLTGNCFDHRRQWIQGRLEMLAGCFAIDVLGFAVMSNHLHVVLRNRPDVVAEWSDDEVARRWWTLFPARREKDGSPAVPQESDLGMVTNNPEKLAEVRKRLSNIGWLMRCLAEPIARRANKEDDCTGRFWEGRYKCQPLLDEAAVAACMAYVDLNPIRAGIASTPESSRFTSAYERILGSEPVLDGSQNKPGEWLSPVELAQEVADEHDSIPVGRCSNRGCLAISQEQYLQLLDWSGRSLRAGKQGRIPADLPDILERLNVSAEGWLSLVSDFSRLFHRAGGRRSAWLGKPNIASKAGSTESATPAKFSIAERELSEHLRHRRDDVSSPTPRSK
jgi:REP element-mobilizing transposase RayT